MRRLPVVVIALLALGGCGIGVPPSLNPPAAITSPPGPAVGVNVDAPDHSVALRNLLLPDPGAPGYPAGGSAPVTVQVYNNTDEAVSLTGATAAGAPVILVAAGETPAPAGDTAFSLSVPARANVALDQQSGRFLLIRCVPMTLPAGTSVMMTFQFSNGTVITVAAPVGLVVSTPAPVPSGARACG